MQSIRSEKKIKCVVWDLDNTVWNGILSEDKCVTLKEDVFSAIKILDKRGILQSIASKNDPMPALLQLETFSIAEYFLYPQINWNTKVHSLQMIAQELNINLDTFAFIDDQAFERDAIKFALPQVRCFDIHEVPALLAISSFIPDSLTDDAQARRQFYITERKRKQFEQRFQGTSEAFLSSLEMVLSLELAQEEDLHRMEELTQRTHQLNSTGYTYSLEELAALRTAPDYLLMIVSLEDKYGSYGKIGLALVECHLEIWTIKLLLMSCRVISRGIGSIMLNYLLYWARSAKVRLHAEFLPTEHNRMMLVTYKLSGFKEIARKEELIIFAHDLQDIHPFPHYIKLIDKINRIALTDVS
ncbi:MAG TPA: HAD-IIIC family phosphatase [Ktedonobacteraceae bacterium]|nr:HAD-IIIC family phosphatase [Ktedonobacteraceae bacterium]